MSFKDIIEEIRPKKLDWYVMKKFITTFFMAILLIIVIIIIFDISEKIDDFVSKEVPLKEIIFDYYVNFIPYYMNMFSPLFVFITVIFFSSRMAANSEIVAVLSCGISFQRFLRPYIFTATIIAALSLVLNLWVIPDANKIRMKFETEYVHSYHANGGSNRNMHHQINPGEFLYIESFSDWNNTAYRVTLEKIENNELVSKLTADQAVWDSTINGWTMKNYFIRTYDAGLEDRVVSGEKLDTVLNITIKDFMKTKHYEKQLNYDELNKFIQTKQERGDADIKQALIERHIRFAMPFSAFILTIIGVSLSSRKKRGGIGWNLALGIALSFSYILFLKFSEMFVMTDTLSAGIATWLPNVIFAGVAYLLYKMTLK